MNHCRYCGRPTEWLISKAGHRYLAEAAPIFNEDGRQIKTIYPAHRCRVTDDERAEIDEQNRLDREARIARGEIMKGQTVIVHKGRKVPVGTTGIVTWVATEPNRYDVMQIRIALENGDAIYLNRDNVRALNTQENAS